MTFIDKKEANALFKTHGEARNHFFIFKSLIEHLEKNDIPRLTNETKGIEGELELFLREVQVALKNSYMIAIAKFFDSYKTRKEICVRRIKEKYPQFKSKVDNACEPVKSSVSKIIRARNNYVAHNNDSVIDIQLTGDEIQKVIKAMEEILNIIGIEEAHYIDRVEQSKKEVRLLFEVLRQCNQRFEETQK